MRTNRILVAVATIAVTLTGGFVATSRHDTASAAVVWNEEFNGPNGAGVDGSRWNFDTGGSGNGNNELQYYTSGTNNVAQDGQGHLVITLKRENPSNLQCWYGRCTYTSGRIQTSGKFSQQYGHIESRARVPRGNGLWPAFWMLGTNIGSVGWPASGEIDIMEFVGRTPNTVYGTIHGPGYSGGSGVGGTRNLSAPVSNDFHIFAIDWSPNLIIWRVDGSEYFRATPASIRGNSWAFNHPFFIILNLAVGGPFPGNPDGSTPFPAQLVVDYVHVSTSDTPPPPTGNAIRSNLSGRCIDIPGANPVDGVRLQTFDCNGTGAQQWSFNGDGTVRALGKCMDAAAAGTANGTAVQLFTCNGTGAQRFTLSASGDLVNTTANRCVDVVNQNTANGAQLQLWDCTGASNQKWTRA